MRKGETQLLPVDSAAVAVQCPRSVLEEMCEAGNWAPTHGITEPWRYVILQGDAIERLNQLKVNHAKATLPAGASLAGSSRATARRQCALTPAMHIQ
jgi:nitroreductase